MARRRRVAGRDQPHGSTGSARAARILAQSSLLLYAGLLRGIAEGVALAAAWVAPSRAARVRPAVEHTYRALDYGGVPVFVIIRLWPW